MRKPAAAAISVAWGAALGGTFGCLLPYLLGYWHFHQPLPYWVVAQVVGGLLIGMGLVPIAQAFIEFIKADGTPVPLASPPFATCLPSSMTTSGSMPLAWMERPLGV